MRSKCRAATPTSTEADSRVVAGALRADPEPSWPDVVHQASEVEAWTTPRRVVDSAGDPGEMLEATHRHLGV
jgi:hypothetical protein